MELISIYTTIYRLPYFATQKRSSLASFFFISSVGVRVKMKFFNYSCVSETRNSFATRFRLRSTQRIKPVFRIIVYGAPISRRIYHRFGYLLQGYLDEWRNDGNCTLSREQIHDLFNNIEEIYNFNRWVPDDTRF